VFAKCVNARVFFTTPVVVTGDFEAQMRGDVAFVPTFADIFTAEMNPVC